MNFPRQVLAIALLVCGCLSVPLTAAASGPADLVFLGGRVYTLNPDRPWAEAVAVRGGKIVAVGDATTLAERIGPGTRQIDLAGGILLPGFIDSHSHPLMGGAYIHTLALDTGADPAAWLHSVKAYAAAKPELEVIFGYGFLASTFGPQGPLASQLDSVVPDRPVFLMDEGMHAAWANTAALRRLAVDVDTPDPAPGFSYYKRDAKGSPTGYLLEDTALQGVEALGVITPDSVATGTADVIRAMNRYGVTATFDAGALGSEHLQESVLDQLAQNGQLTLHLVGSHFVGKPEHQARAVALTLEKKQRTGAKPYRIDTLKIMNDGTLEGRTAGMFNDYQGEPGNSGETIFTQAQLTRLVRDATEAGLDLHIHALGERTIAEALTAIEETRNTLPDSDNRITICHVQIIRDSEIERMAALGVVAQSTPLWASYDSYGEQFVSADQFDRYFRFNSFSQSGVRMSFGSDYPASGAGVLGMSPMLNIEIGHTRQYPGQPDAPVQPPVSERLDIASLIRGYTLDAAWQLRMEEHIGSVEVGKSADFVVLGASPFDVPAHQIHQIPVVQTWFQGEQVYAAVPTEAPLH